jgi:hypothetical protein
MADKKQDRAAALAEFYAAPDDALFNQVTIAFVRDCSEATMERDRWKGKGIPYFKINGAVRYTKKNTVTWLAKPTINSTSEGA